MDSKTITISEDDILPFEMNYLPAFFIQKCKVELNETPEGKNKALQELRYLLKQNPITCGIDFHEDYLVANLRRNKYRIADTHRQVENEVNLFKKETRLFKSVPEEYLDISSSKFILPLPRRCPEGCALLFVRWGKWNPDELPLEQIAQLLVLTLSQSIRDPMTQINGYKLILDYRDVSFKTVKYLTPKNLYLFYHGPVNCFPVRYKRIHVINFPLIYQISWAVIKTFFSQKMKSRIIFHKNTKSLLDHFPRSVLPAEYGGDIRDIDLIDWTRKANKEHETFSVAGLPNYY